MVDEEDAAEEILQRRHARSSFLGWCETILAYRGLRPALHHRLIIDELQGVADGETERLMIFAPPGSAKSTIVTILFPTYLFYRFGNTQILGASHTSALAEDFSTKIQQVIREHPRLLGYGLQTEQKSRWYTTNGGSYLASGVGGAIPGYRGNWVLIDDPTRGREAADSQRERDATWNWYGGDLERRLTPHAPIALIQTRWHQDDLAGRLLETEGDRWRVLTLRAEAEEDDPLGRAPGEWLWSDDDYGYGDSLREIRDSLAQRGATREWASQYQQRPRPAEGILFKVHNIEVLDAAPVGGAFCRAWDLAATKDIGSRDPDWTRGVLLQRTPDRRYVVHDVVGCRGGPDEVERLIKHVAANIDGRGVTISLPQDPGQAGKAQVEYLTRMLAGFTVHSSPETGDKATRAGPVASQCNVGNLAAVRGPYLASFLEELSAFPAGAHDDQVDSLSRAFSELGIAPAPFNIDASLLARARAGSLMPRIGQRSLLTR